MQPRCRLDAEKQAASAVVSPAQTRSSYVLFREVPRVGGALWRVPIFASMSCHGAKRSLHVRNRLFYLCLLGHLSSAFHDMWPLPALCIAKPALATCAQAAAPHISTLSGCKKRFCVRPLANHGSLSLFRAPSYAREQRDGQRFCLLHEKRDRLTLHKGLKRGSEAVVSGLFIGCKL